MSTGDVIYVDDELDTDPKVMMLRRVIEEAAGRSIKAFCEPAEVMRLIEDPKTKTPELIVLDVRTQAVSRRLSPGSDMCGLQIAKAANDRWGKVPSLFLTVDPYMDESHYKAAQLRGYVDFIPKTSVSLVKFLEFAVRRVCCGTGPIEAGPLWIDPSSREVRWRAKRLTNRKEADNYELNEREFVLVDCILVECLKKKKSLATYQAITGSLRSGMEDIEHAFIHSVMANVRIKLTNFANDCCQELLRHDDVFKNVHSRGYRLGRLLSGDHT